MFQYFSLVKYIYVSFALIAKANSQGRCENKSQSLKALAVSLLLIFLLTSFLQRRGVEVV
jgi:hypothetical protein